MGAAHAFRHILPGHLHMDAARPGAFRRMRLEEAADLAQDGVEPAGLAAVAGRDGVAVHRVAEPHHFGPGLAHRPQQAGEPGLQLFHAHAADQRQPPGLVGRVQPVDEAQQIVGLGRGPDLEADRIADAAHEFDMGAVELARAVADPEEMRRTAIGVAGRGVDAGQRLLIGQQQRLMARIEFRLPDLGGGLRRHAAGAS